MEFGHYQDSNCHAATKKGMLNLSRRSFKNNNCFENCIPLSGNTLNIVVVKYPYQCVSLTICI